MKVRYFNYYIRYYGKDEESDIITQTEAEKIMLLLTKNPSQKFILLNDNLIAVSSIKKIEKSSEEKLWNGQEQELTGTEETIHKQFLELTNQNKLLE